MKHENCPTCICMEEDMVLRGGSWLNDMRHTRSVYRIRDLSSYRYDRFGFRVVQDMEERNHEA